ncbi:MAG: hypothetical protein NUV61_00455 [Candidatus Azambacteria bacterium]|nr:hypothetical protein [Candidatus Azambacteria bacterium]
MKMVSMETSYKFDIVATKDAVRDAFTTFEPPKEPVNKGLTPAFADVNPIWLRG